MNPNTVIKRQKQISINDKVYSPNFPTRIGTDMDVNATVPVNNLEFFN